MPLLDSESGSELRAPVSPPPPSPSSTSQTSMDVEDGGYRPRAGSGGIKDFFRRRQKSGDDRSKVAGPGNGPVAPGNVEKSKMKQFMNVIRPRAKSDANTMQAGGRPRSRTVDESHDVRVDLDVMTKSPPSGATNTMMGRLQTHHVSMTSPEKATSDTDVLRPEQFLAAFRERAYTDPRQRTRQAAANAARKKQVRVYSATRSTSCLLPPPSCLG